MSAFWIPSGWELWIVVGVAMLLFGHRIPSIARSIGSGFHELKKALPRHQDQLKNDKEDRP